LLIASRICGFDEAAQARLRKADFAYITACAFPDEEDFERLLITCNWFNWVSIVSIPRLIDKYSDLAPRFSSSMTVSCSRVPLRY
jgi:hypothetical protein